jgi:two-component system, chemotaxis family, sensor histidine kinase and response regulator WspE
MSSDDLSGVSLLDLFRIETENQAQVLTQGLLALERAPTSAEELEACMRAAHSLKGAARIVDRSAAVTVAHAMEDCFVAAQEGRLTLDQAHIDWLLRGIDFLTRAAKGDDAEAATWSARRPRDRSVRGRNAGRSERAAVRRHA